MSIDWKKLGLFNSSEEDILANKNAGRVYVADFANAEGKYISTVFDEDTDPYDLSIKISPRVEIRITYLTKDEKISGVQISKLTNGKIERLNFSTLTFEGILGVLQIFSGLDLKSISNKSILLDSNIVSDPEQLRAHLNTILADENGLKIISEVAAAKGIIADGDIGNIKKKREALVLFDKLLRDEDFFESKKQEWQKRRDEDVWQKFFEENKWIFGYGLEYVFNAPITKEKFEQTLKGSTFLEKGKRPDGILKTLGITQFLNIVEIKTHKHDVLNDGLYRKSGVWQVSDEMNGAVAQCQQYVRTSTNNLNELFELKDDDGNRTGEEVFNFNPKCFLIIGDMRREFVDEENEEKVLNPDKLSCFEYYRRNMLTPEIITYDQLYYRAKNIIENES